MYTLDKLFITEITVEHMHRPLGIDCSFPRFCWKLKSEAENVKQTAYQLVISSDKESLQIQAKLNLIRVSK